MKNAHLGLIFSLLLSVFAVFIATIGKAAPAPVRPKTGVLILDNCDPDYKNRAAYEDNVTLLNSEGKIAFRVSGLNNAESTGCSHMVAADFRRGWIWVLENVGNRIHKYDRTGKELLVVKDIEALALAVDPDTGALWVLTAKRTIYGDKTAVFDDEGRRVATYEVSGYDIAYDPKSKSFWIAGQNLAKVSKSGEVILQKPITTWCASSLAVHPSSGTVWVAVRQHFQVPGSQNELQVFDNDGTWQKTIDLEDKMPFHVSIDSRDGAVWLTLFRKAVRRYTSKGELAGEYEAHALTAETDARTGGVWVVTPEETQLVSRKGEVSLRVKHKANTTQAWIAPWQ